MLQGTSSKQRATLMRGTFSPPGRSENVKRKSRFARPLRFTFFRCDLREPCLSRAQKIGTLVEMLIPQIEVLVRKNGEEIARQIVQAGDYIIGRDETAEIRIEGVDLVSRQHAKLIVNYSEI